MPHLQALWWGQIFLFIPCKTNVGVRLLIFEKIWRKQKLKNDRNALIDVKMN